MLRNSWSRHASRAAGTLLTTAAVTAGLVVAPAPAAATENYRALAPTSWAYTDSRTPNTTVRDSTGTAPVGAWRQGPGPTHVSKSYFTFDLTGLRGARIIAAQAVTEETAVVDCAKPRSTELWVTDVNEAPTWAAAPRERTKLVGPNGFGCPSSWLSWDAAEQLRAAVAAGRSKLTVALRIAAAHQGEVAYGRRHASDLRLTVTYNFPPNTPTNLAVGQNTPCAADPIFTGEERPRVSASTSDPDGTYGLTARFAFWPVEHPDQRTEVTTYAYDAAVAAFPAPLADGGRYAWAIRLEDGHDVSAWSAPCELIADLTRPDVAPLVSSTVYPEESWDDPVYGGGPGVPGEFVFDANGVDDVAGFRYVYDDVYHYVAADALGGRATVTITPDSWGPHRLNVFSADRAGNNGPTTEYHFLVDTNAPEVTSPTGEHGELGVPKEFTVEPGMDGVVEYVYQLTGGAEHTVAAEPDGTATITVTPTRAYDNSLAVRGRKADGVESESGGAYFRIEPDEPRISHTPEEGQLGVPAEFTFHNDRTDIGSYTYEFGNAAAVTVPADPDGTTTVLLTPIQWGTKYLTVPRTTTDGYYTGWSQTGFFVDPAEPVVDSPQYPEQETGGGVGVPGDFTFSTSMVNVTEYVYQFEFGGEIVVPADENGRATVSFTPNREGWFSLTVKARTATGIESAENYYPFAVTPTP